MFVSLIPTGSERRIGVDGGLGGAVGGREVQR